MNEATLALRYNTLKRTFIILLILGFVFCSRGFAHFNIRIGSMLIYITEAVLLVVIVNLFFDKLIAGNKIKYLQNIPLKKEFMLFYFIGAISLFRGLLLFSPVLTLRHSAIVYYSAFYFIIPILFNRLEKIERLFKFVFISCLLVSIAVLLKLNFRINEYGGLGGFNYLYLSIAIIFESFYYSFLKKTTHKILLILIIFTQLFVILIGQVRGAWVALLISFLFLWRLSIRKGKLNKKIVRVFSSITLVGIILICAVAIAAPSLFNRVTTEAATIVLFSRIEDVSSYNTQWRLIIWGDMAKEIFKNPLIGYGFGNRFLSPSLKERGWEDPHNSFLNLTHKTGMIGLFAFLLIITKFFKRTMRFVRYTCKDKKIKLYSMALLVCFVYILVLSLSEVVLEGPYMGSFLWISMGLAIALENIYKKKTHETERV